MIDSITMWSVIFTVAVPIFGVFSVWWGFRNQDRPPKKKLRKRQMETYVKIRRLSSWTLISAGVLFVAFGIYMLPQSLDFSGLTILDDNQHRLSKYISETNPILLEKLREIDTGSWASFPLLSKSSAGFYMGTTRTITIKYQDISRDVYWHELFHHIWFWELNDDERNAFRALHNLNIAGYALNLSDLRPFPSHYAMKSVEEDWGDTGILFAAGLNSTYGADIDRRRYLIVEHTIRRITACNLTEARMCLFNDEAFGHII